jgi:hypothetical protein
MVLSSLHVQACRQHATGRRLHVCSAATAHEVWCTFPKWVTPLLEAAPPLLGSALDMVVLVLSSDNGEPAVPSAYHHELSRYVRKHDPLELLLHHYSVPRITADALRVVYVRWRWVGLISRHLMTAQDGRRKRRKLIRTAVCSGGSGGRGGVCRKPGHAYFSEVSAATQQPRGRGAGRMRCWAANADVRRCTHYRRGYTAAYMNGGVCSGMPR